MKVHMYQARSQTVMSHSLQPHGPQSLSMEFSRQEYWSAPHLQCLPFPPALAADSPDSANPGLAGITSFISNYLKRLQCVTISNEQQELQALEPGDIPSGWQVLVTWL